MTLLVDGYAREEVPVASAQRQGLLVRLARAGRLAGRVLDGNSGEPIQSFQIRFVDPLLEEGDERLWGYGAVWSDPGYAFVDSDGHWETGDERLDPGRVIGIEALADGYAPGVAPRVLVRPDPDPKDTIIRLYRGATIGGSVVASETGLPVGDALVRRFSEREPLSPRPRLAGEESWTRTDADGRFEFEGLSNEPMSLAVEHEEFVLAIDGPLEPTEGAHLERTIALARGFAISGSLLTGAGEPLARETIVVHPMSGDARGRRFERATAQDGRFRIAGLVDGRYQVSWSTTRGERTIYPLTGFVEIDGADTRLELQPTGQATVSGTLLVDGELAPDAYPHVMLRPLSAGGAATDSGEDPRILRATFASDGRFEFDHVRPGSWMLAVDWRLNGTVLRGSRTIEVPAGGELRIDLPCR